MPLPTSGPLTLANIQTEFGGVNPIGLNEYYAGGGRVPPGTTGTYGAVPSSGAISIRNFYGTSAGATIVLSNQSIADFTGGGSNASAGYQLTSAGAANEIVGTSTSFLETWCSPSGEAVNYEVFVTVTGSPLTIGFVNAWTALSTTRTWRLDAGIGQNLFTTLSVQVRRVGTTTPVYSATVDLNADASF
jgi:hypothetical protein